MSELPGGSRIARGRRGGPIVIPWLLIVGPPCLAGILYRWLTWSLIRPPLWELMEQVFVLMVWTAGILASWYLLRSWVRRVGGGSPCRVATAFLALMQCLLLMVHLLGVLGVRSWGQPPTFPLVVRFVPDAFNLMDALSLPRFLVPLLSGVPLGLSAIIGWMAGNRLERTLEGRLHRVLGRVPLPWALAAFAFLGVLLIGSRDVDLGTRGHFMRDPIVSFLKGDRVLLPMTGRRLHWAEKDILARKNLCLRKPRVRNVILLIVDSLRADHLSIYGYPRPVDPFLSEMVGRGRARTVPWTFSNGPESRGGILALLTSKDIPTLSQYSYSLMDFFSDHGYRVWMILSGDHRWFNLRKAYGSRVDRIVDGSDGPGPRGVSDDALLLRETDRLPDDDGKPHFIVYHLMSVHEVGPLQDRFLRYRPTLPIFLFSMNPKRKASPAELDAVVNMYDDRILQMDEVVRGLFRSLGRKGYLRDYVAVLTADHGELLGENGNFSHIRTDMSWLSLRIPVVFLSSFPLPSFPSGEFATQVDVGPTLADLAGLEIPSTWQGRSLMRGEGERWTSHVNFCEVRDSRMAMVYHRPGVLFKYTRAWGDAGRPGREQVIDLVRDPAEKEDLLSSGRCDPRILREMRRRAADLMAP